jgi:hypothetical protein
VFVVCGWTTKCQSGLGRLTGTSISRLSVKRSDGHVVVVLHVFDSRSGCEDLTGGRALEP